ncbi:flagellar biosynthesis anti-sigma factor FlgM [Armatimonas sp.]|uniref:flagellar biosynthesis anti-sigma factor FlgM n=1 Tax=Armatimonas sp. TaxID=1872638 RepID=UPI00286CE983|nr:flagellar biosynthesis anti-sigma factor FlgM [Armatimonas sp.]
MRVDNAMSISAINALRGVKSRRDDAPGEGPDAAVFSQRAKDIQTAFEALQATPEVRSAEVTVLRAQIEEGTFQVDEDALAEKLLRGLH